MFLKKYQFMLKYIIIVIVVILLAKAFANVSGLENIITNESIICGSIALLALILVLDHLFKQTCPSKKERLENIQNSIYPMVPQQENKVKPEKTKNVTFKDDDVEELIDVVGADREVIKKLEENEQKASDKIKQNYKDEMVYTTTHPFNTVPLGANIYGYTFLPPENWFRAYEKPPICIPNGEKHQPVGFYNSSTAELMEFDGNGDPIPPGPKFPQGFNERYVNKVLNKKN